jgi:glycosyltransferase 2 family protein
MLKTIIVNSLKLLIAAALIGWLLKSGKLDFKLLTNLKDHPLSILMVFILSVFNFALISIRWRKILSARTTIKLPITGLMKIT